MKTKTETDQDITRNKGAHFLQQLQRTHTFCIHPAHTATGKGQYLPRTKTGGKVFWSPATFGALAYNDQKQQRNDPCRCGSGLKYKNCGDKGRCHKPAKSVQE